MNNSSFVHLHNHLSYSLLDGMCKIPKLVAKAKEYGFKFLTIADHGNVDGSIKFQKECLANDITPIIACEVYITKDFTIKEKGVKSYHCLLIVKNEIGWHNLLKMLTIANINGFYYKPRLDYNTLLQYNDGLIISTACSKSFLLDDAGTECFLKIAKERDYEDVYLEIMPHLFKEQTYINDLCYSLHKKYNIPLICSNDCHYVNKEDSESHEVLLAIQTKTNMKDPKRWKFNSNEYYFKTANEMIASFEKQNQFEKFIYLQAMKNTLSLARSCNFKIPKHEMSLPQVPGLENIDEDKYLRQLVIDGYYKRVNDNIIDPIYEQRFEHELDIISRKGFTRYFLIVHDLVNWMRRNKFFMSPGRGSVGSSLIAYLIGITNVDSIKYNLPFSRFINEERVDMPDVDLDICDNRREEAISYLKSTYGEDNIANIGTFLTLKSRGIVRDVARVFDIPLKEVDEFSKTINEDIETALKEKTGETFQKKYPEVVRHALVLEGIEKSYGRHAAGIVLSKDNLKESGKCYLRLSDKSPTVNWDLGDAETQGLLKLDALGLNALSILSETNRLVLENHKIEIDFHSLELNDSKIFEELSKGNTIGVFQFGTKPMTELVKRMGIANFEEMYAAVALVRPGASDSGITDEYIERKHGKEWERKHPIYEEVTKDTYGVYCFQEQVMNIIHKVAGLPYPIADQIRKIIGKKRDSKEFEKYKDMFVGGCLKQKTLTQFDAEEFWEQLQYAASYLFNQCLCYDETIFRHKGRKKKSRLTIEEMFLIKNDVGYATRTGHLDLRSKYRNYGYGMVLSMSEDGRLRRNEIVDIYESGLMPVYELKTEDGNLLKCTMNHKIPTENGIKLLSEISVGDSLFIKGEYEKTTKKYNLYADGKVQDNLPKPGERGFQKRPNGNSVIYEDKKAQCHRDKLSCSHCQKEYSLKSRFELHHKDFDRTNNRLDNLEWLCASCHKKIHYKNGRVKIYEKGIPTKLSKIVSINYIGMERCYDVEIKDPYHNFLTGNEIVVCNSHSVEYSMLGYWTMYAKLYYPSEFIAASLTMGSDTHKPELVKEARRLGLDIIPPKIGLSDPFKWLCIGNKLHIPFNEIKGFGEKTLNKLQLPKYENGFYSNPEVKIEIKGKPKKILEEINAFDVNAELPVEAYKYFDFDLSEGGYDKLLKLLNITKEELDIDKGLRGELEGLKLIKKRKIPEVVPWEELENCKDCELREECSKPIYPSLSRFNIMIIGESGWKDEDKQGRGLVGKNGQRLWEELSKYEFNRYDFHVSSIVKCSTLQSRTPKESHIIACNKWLDMEIEFIKPFMILAMGNLNVMRFKNQKSGIMRLNATTEWNDKYGCYISWIVNPSAALRNEENNELFKLGIRNFVEKLEKLGGI